MSCGSSYNFNYNEETTLRIIDLNDYIEALYEDFKAEMDSGNFNNDKFYLYYLAIINAEIAYPGSTALNLEETPPQVPAEFMSNVCKATVDGYVDMKYNNFNIPSFRPTPRSLLFAANECELTHLSVPGRALDEYVQITGNARKSFKRECVVLQNPTNEVLNAFQEDLASYLHATPQLRKFKKLAIRCRDNVQEVKGFLEKTIYYRVEKKVQDDDKEEVQILHDKAAFEVNLVNPVPMEMFKALVNKTQEVHAVYLTPDIRVSYEEGVNCLKVELENRDKYSTEFAIMVFNYILLELPRQMDYEINKFYDAPM